MRRTTSIHSGWQFSAKQWLAPPAKLGCSDLEWLPATVPGHVHADLFANGVIPDPFEGLHELGCQWIDEVDWTYRTRFSFTPDPALPRRVLRFEGLDTVCSVRLNGQRIATHDNMFVPLEVDVTETLRVGENELVVEFESATRVGNERRSRFLAREGLSNDVLRFDERAFVRKAQYMFGWDWGPRLVSAGVWGAVELVEYAARLLDVWSTQEHLPDGTVELSFRSEVDGDGEVLHFVEGSTEPLQDGEVLRLGQPELWWPAGLGAQRLHAVTSLLVPRTGASTAEREKHALDVRTLRLGLRSVRLVREDDRFGQSFELEVNGKRIWAVGANWIPDSSFPAQVSRERVRLQLGRARDMNMNMLRVWGGGLYESDDFYDACDELGILVWQDFPYACSYYPDGSDACAVARDEARAAVKRLRNRASLALWCGNNENLTMFESKWGDPSRHPRRYYGEVIYERVLPEVLAALDPGRPYIPTSPWGGEQSNSDGTGDQHYWDVWHGRGDWVHYQDSGARFSSEFGFAAAPGHSVFRKIAPRAAEPLALDVRDPAARWHDKTAKGYETFIGYVELHYPVSRTIEEWIYHSQLNQRDALRHAIEHYRRSEFCKGSLIWQLNDCWPVQSWAVVDSDFNYKAAAYELRRLYAPAFVSIERIGSQLRVWVALDNSPNGNEGRATLEVRSLIDGHLMRSEEADVALGPGERRVALTLDVADWEPEQTILVARWLGNSTARLLAEPKDLRLPQPTLFARSVEGGVEVESDVPVVDLFLWDASAQLKLEDNFVTLVTPGRVTLRASGPLGELSARSLAGRHSIELR